MRVGSLFSGIGGFDLGLERAGMTVRWQCEIDKAAQSVLRRRFPDAVLYDDVRKVTNGIGNRYGRREGASQNDAGHSADSEYVSGGAWDRTSGGAEPVDLLCGGFPCQDLSVAGKRAGLAGERSGLFYEFMRIAGELAPRWFLIENVPGLLSSQGGRDMGAVLGTLGELGYGWAYRILDAQYFGVAQRRRRVFIVGCLGDAARAAQVLFEPESCAGDPAPGRETGTRVTQSLTGSAASSSCGNPDDNRAQGGFLVADVFPTLPANRGGPGSQDWQQHCAVVSPLRNTLPAQNCNNGGGGGGGLLHSGMAVRRLTPTECERLQGFPGGWTDGQLDSARYRQLGNAVCVPVAEWIGRRIMEAQ